jgi:hypothetical protein
MSFSLKKTAALTAVLALGAVPALAAPPSNQGTAHKPTTPTNTTTTPTTPVTPGPDASASAKAKAYGKNCQGFSKKHVAGQKGTPFSQCVTAMAKAATNAKTNPTTACKSMSKKHVKGEKGTPFSRCVSAAAKLQKQQAADEQPTS